MLLLMNNTTCEECSDIDILLLLLLSSRPKMKDLYMLDPCLWDDGRELLEARPTNEDCSVR